MITVTDEQFEHMITLAMDRLRARFQHADNVGIVMADEPTPDQRVKLQLRGDQTLFGLYEGIPLTARNNAYSGVLPDKITLFKVPLSMSVNNEKDLQEAINHTLWHELAHHFGLNHQQIREKE